MRARVPAALAALALAAAVPFLAGACAPQAPPQAACDYCRMLVTDPAFGGSIRTADGRLRRYDAIECMAAAVLTDSVPPATIRSIAVKDHERPHAELPAGRATFLHSAALESPMGAGLAAFRSRAGAEASRATHPGALLDWGQVVARVDTAWFGGALDAPAHARLPDARP